MESEEQEEAEDELESGMKRMKMRNERVGGKCVGKVRGERMEAEGRKGNWEGGVMEGEDKEKGGRKKRRSEWRRKGRGSWRTRCHLLNVIVVVHCFQAEGRPFGGRVRLMNDPARCLWCDVVVMVVVMKL